MSWKSQAYSRHFELRTDIFYHICFTKCWGVKHFPAFKKNKDGVGQLKWKSISAALTPPPYKSEIFCVICKFLRHGYLTLTYGN